MYHLELRHFPHNLCQFNLTERELRAVVDPWTRDRWVEVGERKWNPEQARLTVIEGPHLTMQQLSMGRGWRTAQRTGEDVTARVLAAASEAASAGASPPTRAGGSATRVPSPAASQGPTLAPSQEPALAADSLGLELLSMLGSDPMPLARAWRIAAARWPERPASECLAVTELAVGSLQRRRLIVVVRSLPDASSVTEHETRGGIAANQTAAAGQGSQVTDGPRAGEQEIEEQEVGWVLRAVDNWLESGRSAPIRIRRA